MSVQTSPGILDLTAQIVSAHLSHNRLETEALPSLIQSVYRSLSTVGDVQPAAAPALSPAVPIKKSVFPDYIVCLEDGKKLKMLKRHLKSSYGMTPTNIARSGAFRRTTQWSRRATRPSGRRLPRRSGWDASRRRQRLKSK